MQHKQGPALYATDVSHYDHVVESMSRVYEPVDLIRRWEPSPQLVRWTIKWHVPRALVMMLERRMRRGNKSVRKSYTFGLSSILPAITIHSGRHLIPHQAQTVARLKAMKVLRTAKRYHLVHFMEGLGYKYLADEPADISICEARQHHHGHYKNPPPVYLNYPAPPPYNINIKAINFEHQMADKILVYSTASKKSFTQNGIDEKKLIVCPLPINLNESRITSERQRDTLLFVGRSDRAKGLDLAVATVQALGEPYTLKVAGPMTAEVQDWMKQYSFVKYLGIQTKKQLVALYSTSSIYLAPSHESYGLAAAEAVYHGCHLVCSDWTGIAEYMPADRVTIIEGRDLRTWTEGVKSALSNWTTADFASIDQTYESLLAKNVTQRLEHIYRSLSNKPVDK